MKVALAMIGVGYAGVLSIAFAESAMVGFVVLAVGGFITFLAALANE